MSLLPPSSRVTRSCDPSGDHEPLSTDPPPGTSRDTPFAMLHSGVACVAGPVSEQEPLVLST